MSNGKTVGDLRKLIENVPDDYKLESVDEYGNEVQVTDIEVMTVEGVNSCLVAFSLPDPDDDES
ncbi:hypothetical protein Q0V21_30545 [Paenibacillus sp. 11B]|uniref:hypothetical protein n=1 Tax=Paenibacillus sp. 11B TaxID=3060965 RepID=UPI002650D006|nr:hypothetical protein [Paenibacillus sp. 11B]MDN8593070.1 hypothetical protein [Paenibacillus sp. 11B]